jgi:hypothetical protein
VQGGKRSDCGAADADAAVRSARASRCNSERTSEMMAEGARVSFSESRAGCRAGGRRPASCGPPR